MGTAAYNIAELGTGVFGEFNPKLVTGEWKAGGIADQKYIFPITEEKGAVLLNSALGLGDSAYNSYTSTLDAWGSSFNSSSAAGGYVIYPNKPNTNMMQSVYHK